MLLFHERILLLTASLHVACKHVSILLYLCTAAVAGTTTVLCVLPLLLYTSLLQLHHILEAIYEQKQADYDWQRPEHCSLGAQCSFRRRAVICWNLQRALSRLLQGLYRRTQHQRQGVLLFALLFKKHA